MCASPPLVMLISEFSPPIRNNVVKNHIALCVAFFCFEISAGETLSFGAEIELGYGYDSNVSVDDVDLSTSIGDQFADIQLSADTTYKARNNIELSVNLALSEKLYNSFNEFDGSLALASLSAGKEVGNFEFGFLAHYIDYKLDNDGFLTLSQLSPTVAWFYKKKSYLHLAYERTNESYERESDRDNSRDGIRASFYYFINGLRKYFSVQAEIGKKEANALIFDNEVWQIEVSYFNQISVLSRDSTIKLAYLRQERDYRESINPSIGDFRGDQRHRYEIELTMPFKKPWSLSSKVIYNNYKSNLTSSDYTQQIYQMTLKYDF